MTSVQTEVHQCSNCGVLWIDECPYECLPYRQHYVPAFECLSCGMVRKDEKATAECCAEGR